VFERWNMIAKNEEKAGNLIRLKTSTTIRGDVVKQKH